MASLYYLYHIVDVRVNEKTTHFHNFTQLLTCGNCIR